MKRAARVLAILLTLVLGAVADDTSPGAAAAAANNAFAIDIYPKIARTNGNLVFSPYSAHSALALTWAGARGATAQQMAAVLHLGRDRAGMCEQLAALRNWLNPSETADKGRQVIVANAIWADKSLALKSDFLKTAREQFGAMLSQVDFKDTDASAKAINDWVSKETSGKIENLISPPAISGASLVLTDAIYCKGRWRKPFPKGATRNAPFHLADGATEDVPLMNVEGQFNYGESKTMQVVDLPFSAGRLSMVLFLPKDPDALAEVERSMNDADMTQNMAWVKPQVVHVFLPRFEFDASFSLQDTLQEMGMTDAFSSDFAKFSGIADGGLFISTVLQKCAVNVNEEGAEAAAATAVIMATGAAPVPNPNAFVFRADHPFMFLIRHNDTGAILFMGRVARP